MYLTLMEIKDEETLFWGWGGSNMRKHLRVKKMVKQPSSKNRNSPLRQASLRPPDMVLVTHATKTARFDLREILTESQTGAITP